MKNASEYCILILAIFGRKYGLQEKNKTKHEVMIPIVLKDMRPSVTSYLFAFYCMFQRSIAYGLKLELS